MKHSTTKLLSNAKMVLFYVILMLLFQIEETISCQPRVFHRQQLFCHSDYSMFDRVLSNLFLIVFPTSYAVHLLCGIFSFSGPS